MAEIKKVEKKWSGISLPQKCRKTEWRSEDIKFEK